MNSSLPDLQPRSSESKTGLQPWSTLRPPGRASFLARLGVKARWPHLQLCPGPCWANMAVCIDNIHPYTQATLWPGGLA